MPELNVRGLLEKTRTRLIGRRDKLDAEIAILDAGLAVASKNGHVRRKKRKYRRGTLRHGDE